MKLRGDNKNYNEYISEQNIVSAYNGDQTQHIDYNKYLQGLHTDSYILDIGCRDGKWLQRLYIQNYKNVFGVDIGSSSYNKAIKKVIGQHKNHNKIISFKSLLDKLDIYT